MKFFRNPLIAFIAVTLLMMSMFVIGSWSVVAQTFIPPSSQAPKNNVIDFISQSATTQSRSGALQINVPDYSVPTSTTPVVKVIGNTYIQGPLVLDQNPTSTSALFVNPSVAQPFVTSGATGVNGKYSIASTGTGLYGQTTTGVAIFAESNGIGAVALFGQTIQAYSPSSLSYGIRAKSTGLTTNNAAIFAQNIGTSCAAGLNCPLAAAFIGNFVVNGTFYGDGRGVFKGWTLNDVNYTTSGIALKTLDLSLPAPAPQWVVDPINANLKRWTSVELDPSSEKFVSMSVMVDGTIYDPSLAADPASPNYISVLFSNSDDSLTVKKNKDLNSQIVVQLFYHKQVDVTISPATKNVLVTGGSVSTLFLASIAGGAPSNSEFTWSLYKNEELTTACDEKCGTMDGANPGNYIAPHTITAGADPVYVKAAWVYDPTISIAAKVNLYALTAQTVLQPQPSAIIGSGNPISIVATSQGPLGATPTVAWSMVTSYGGMIPAVCTKQLSCTYIAPGSMTGATPPPWNDIIQAQIDGIADLPSATITLHIIPTVTITATNSSTSKTYITTTLNVIAEVGQGQTLGLYAIANGVPSAFANTFGWSASGTDLISPAATAYPSPLSTTYTAPNLTTTPRVVKAQWTPDDTLTAFQTLNVAQGDAQNASFSRQVSTSGSHSLTINGYVARTLSLPASPTVPLVDNQTVSSGVCGTLIFNSYTPATDGVTTCDPTTTQCVRTANFTYTASNIACNGSVILASTSDPRDTTTISLQSTSIQPPSCYCTKKPYCPPAQCGQPPL